uniref:THD domain-containing protein n=1 Tax=Electrophorus electricus TaxID=8005 RepID=A0A4W4HDU5_ELEEL
MSEADSVGGLGPCPQVFVVDSQAPTAHMPVRASPRAGRQSLYALYLLVALALLGITIEAAFISQLYHRKPEMQVSEHACVWVCVAWGGAGCGSVARGDGVMEWQTEGLSPFLRGLQYNAGALHIHTEGFYYIYSKVCFSENCFPFKHQVMRRSPRYSYAPTNLMESLRYSHFILIPDQPFTHFVTDSRSAFHIHAALVLGSSAGVFHLYKNDSVYVQVNNGSLLRTGVYDNFFGVFMI